MEHASTTGELRGLEEEGSGFSSRDSPGENEGYVMRNSNTISICTYSLVPGVPFDLHDSLYNWDVP